MKSMRLVALFLALALLFTACGEDMLEAAADGKTLIKVGIIGEPATLDPQGGTLITQAEVAVNIYDTLISQNTVTGEIEPRLATSWQQVDDYTMRFTLRQDVYFHNGEHFTAEDVIYTLKRATTSPASKSLLTPFDAENSKIIDDYTVEIKLKSKFAAALAYLGNQRCYIVNQKAVEEYGDKFGRNPVGTGPYKFISWNVGDRIVMEANEKYWGKQPPIQRAEFRFITDSGIMAIELEAGELDFIYVVGSEDYERLNDAPDINVFVGPGFTHESLYFNMKAEMYADVKVRMALTYALDVPALVKAVFGDLAKPADSVFSSTIFGHTVIGPRKRDVAYAKKLLAEAGHPNGFDCEIMVPNNSETLNMLEIAQAMWKEAGINVKISSLDQATLKELNANGKNPFGRSNFTASSGDPDHALAAWSIGYTGVLQPSDENLNDMLRQGREEYDTTKRVQIYEKIQSYILDEKYYAIPLAFPYSTYALRSNIKGFQFIPSQIQRLEELSM
ncbi:MAG: ABC transporter substrate-binding protein [Synergistaceae bacterium]|jgi:peptide/nickel transport system substrate-binding protein|nr:ABC transporter substrate-binding protein [Synergistaceae bacterium]